MTGPFVDVAWLHAHPDVVVADVRWYLDGRSGRGAWEAGHLPGAVHVDVDAVLAGPPSPAQGRHPLPDPAAFAAALGALGVADDDVVVAYDDDGGVVASRLVWLLRAVGRPAALLDGGLTAWDGPLETGVTTRPAVTRAVRPWPAGRLALADDVAIALAAGSATVLDARDPARYRGDAEPVDPRAGHLPGALNRPARAWTGADGRLRPAAELQGALADVGADVVSSCGSGVTACHTLLVLEQLGRPPGRLYPGSWSQWSADPDRPVARGPEPGRLTG